MNKDLDTNLSSGEDGTNKTDLTQDPDSRIFDLDEPSFNIVSTLIAAEQKESRLAKELREIYSNFDPMKAESNYLEIQKIMLEMQENLVDIDEDECIDFLLITVLGYLILLIRINQVRLFSLFLMIYQSRSKIQTRLAMRIFLMNSGGGQTK